MSQRLVAHSISRPVRARLGRPEPPPRAEARDEPLWRVLAVFDRACDLVGHEGEVVALVTPAVGDGPFNLVVEPADPPALTRVPSGADRAFPELVRCPSPRESPRFAGLEPGMPARTAGETLQVGPLAVSWTGARVWDPTPDWLSLRQGWDTIQGRLGRLGELACPGPRRSPAVDCTARSLLAPRAAALPDPQEQPRAAHLRAATQALQAGWAGDGGLLRHGAAMLAGWGPGLTPAGDDYLCGAMLRAWLNHPDPPAFCRPIAATAAPRTTTLSAAWLRAAAAGQCSAGWHRLLSALGSGSQLRPAVQAVLAFGATSGADALAGFLALGPVR